MSLEDIITAMKKIDDNGDGVIDFEECATMLYAARPKPPKPHNLPEFFYRPRPSSHRAA